MRNPSRLTPVVSRLAACLCAVIALSALGGCTGKSIEFHYPAEHITFPGQGIVRPTLYVEFIHDMRPEVERVGKGKMFDITFPGDEDWDRPVQQIYYEALVQDLTQTELVALVPMRAQADYVLEVDLQRLGARLKRSAGGYMLAALTGAGVGYVVTQSAGGAAGGVVLGIGAMPMPARMEATAEVRLRLYDTDHELVWDRACRGERVKEIWTGVTARNDQEWVDSYLTVAVKRCNACLLGQLRQALLSAGEPIPDKPRRPTIPRP